MLALLNIRNLAVIDEVELELGPGLTVLTGETGAGKSILVDALALALGERADSRAIRTGTDRCEITATFEVGARPDVLKWLADNDLDEDTDCILRRVVTADGRSRGYVNGRSVPMQTLRELGEQLVDICGQQSHQSLRHARVQQGILDDYGGHAGLLTTMSEAFEHWAETLREFEELQGAHADCMARIELLHHQVGELEALNPHPGEFAQLEQAHRLAANSARITEGVSRALDRVYAADDESVHSALSGVRRGLDDLTDIDPELKSATSMLAEAAILVAEAAETLRHHLGGLEHDPATQAQIEQRLASMHELARKHHVDPIALPDLLLRLTEELATLETSDQRIEALGEQTRQLEGLVREAAEGLTAARRSAGGALAEQVTNQMQRLGMPGGTFDVDLRPAADGLPGPNGIDRIEFVVTANPGQAAGPLAKVASGGELSRISLSLQVVALAMDAVPTLIFDEVDAGVGGGVAEIVGGRLRELAGQRQVLCVTHLPQVASQAHHHLRVAKLTDGHSTRTTVGRLNRAARVEEIARMLGGIEITARTRAHADEMLGGENARKAG